MAKPKQKQSETRPEDRLVQRLNDILTNPAEKKKTITLFMIIVFSILLTMTAYLDNLLMKIWFQIILFIAQLVIVNTILTDYYSN